MRSLAAVTLTLGIVGASAASAQGMADLHSKVVVGKKLCMADHFHSGNSSGLPTKVAAERDAIRNWQEFTAWEYGNAWGSFAAALSKSINCQGGGQNWGCYVEARPCRAR